MLALVSELVNESVSELRLIEMLRIKKKVCHAVQNIIQTYGLTRDILYDSLALADTSRTSIGSYCPARLFPGYEVVVVVVVVLHGCFCCCCGRVV